MLRVCARDARRHALPPVRESEMRAVDRGFPEIQPGFGFATNGMGAASGAADAKASYCRSMGKHMFELCETSAERLDERLDRWKLTRRT
jgi:hypothetical protein